MSKSGATPPCVTPDHASLYKNSITNRDKFWGDVARERILWREPFHTVSDCDFKKGKVSWFLGGKLTSQRIVWIVI